MIKTILVLALLAGAEAQPVRHRVTGLFSRDREEDLREAVKKLADVTVVAIDFDTAEVTFSYDPAKLFPKAKQSEIPDKFDALLKSVSSHTFGAKPLCATPKEKLTRIEIPVFGVDCKGCELAAYESVSKIDGVEQATASFRENRVTALIDPARTGRAALEEALKKRNVKLKEKE